MTFQEKVRLQEEFDRSMQAMSEIVDFLRMDRMSMEMMLIEADLAYEESRLFREGLCRSVGRSVPTEQVNWLRDGF